MSYNIASQKMKAKKKKRIFLLFIPTRIEILRNLSYFSIQITLSNQTFKPYILKTIKIKY